MLRCEISRSVKAKMNQKAQGFVNDRIRLNWCVFKLEYTISGSYFKSIVQLLKKKIINITYGKVFPSV